MIDFERDERVKDWVITVYSPAVKIIAELFVELGDDLHEADHNARTVIARLAQADPPIYVTLLSTSAKVGASEELLRAAEVVSEAFKALGSVWIMKALDPFYGGKEFLAALIRLRTAIIDVKEGS